MGVDKSGSHSVECQVGGEDAVHVAVETAHHFGNAAGLGQSDAARLAIIVEEIVANLCEHGGCSDGSPAKLALADHGDLIAIAVADYGPPFDPREREEIDLPNEDRGGGVGLAIVRAWSESLNYRSANGRNLLTLALRRLS